MGIFRSAETRYFRLLRHKEYRLATMKLVDLWLSTLLAVLLAASSVAFAVGPAKRGVGNLVPSGGSTAKVAVPKSSTQTHVASVTSDMDTALIASGGASSAPSEVGLCALLHAI